jgi:hypothetical protein
MSNKLMGNLQNGEKVHTDDKKSRDLVTDFVKKVLNWDVISNPDKFLIDLIFVDKPHVGIEIEEGQYHGDFWCHEKSLFLRNADPEVPFRTCNFQKERKGHFWKEGPHYYENGDFWYHEYGHLENIFCRHNLEMTQIILIMPEVIRDPEKSHIARKKPETIYKKDPELWQGTKKIDCITYNLIGNDWVLCDKSIEEIERLKIISDNERLERARKSILNKRNESIH